MKVPYLDEVGEFPIQVINPYWQQLDEKNGDKNRMALVLPCCTAATEQFPVGRKMDFYIYFTRNLVTGGRNKGKKQYEAAMEQCIELGASEPFSPDKVLEELNGAEAVLVTKEEEYEGKKRVKPAFLNTMHRPPITSEKATEIWTALTGGAAAMSGKPKAKAEPKSAPSNDPADDDIPFGP